MSTDQLGTALRDLVHDVEDGVVPPAASELWAAGLRRRRTARVVPLVAAACVAALVALVAWPSGVQNPTVPAVRVDEEGVARLTAYPDVIAKPPFLPVTTTPGVTAAVVQGADPDQTYAVSPAGAVTVVRLPASSLDSLQPAPALSPDGRWVARGLALTDLVHGASLPSAAHRARLERRWMPPQEPGWWSSDSRRLFLAAPNQGTPEAGGLVLDVEGTTSEVPLIDGGLQATFAGWLGDRTLLALLDLGPGTSHLEVRTWSLGDPSWAAPGTVLSWTEGEEPAQLRALLSPDGQRLLLTTTVEGRDGEVTQTRAMMFDPRTGARLGMPLNDGTLDASRWAEGSFIGWDGWGCRPVWHDGLPVRTDGGVTAFVDARSKGPIGGSDDVEMVSVSSGYGSACVAFAGNHLRGTPVTNHLALWRERLWSWAPPLLGLSLLALAAWAWSRRHAQRWRRPPKRLPPIITQPF